MLKKIFLGFFLLFSASIFAQSSPVFTDNKTPIKVMQNQTFCITLPSNMTTGYSWKWHSNIFDSRLVSLVGHRYFAPNTKLVGAPGYEVWTFKANPSKSGQPYAVRQVGHIVMEYQRPWDKTPGKKQVFIVYVK